MNKKALLDYALFARKELETQIALSLNKLGIYKDKILKANVVGDYTIIEGNPDSYPKRVYNLRKMMISEYFEGEEKFETVVEEFAYTWFNRLVAIRFMEVHDYFPHGFHVLTSRDGSYEPEILSNLPYVLSELSLEEDVIRSLRDQNKTEELYRYVLVKQCSALSKIIPDIFDVREPYLELLLPNNLLSQDSVIRKIELIPEEDFMNDVEVVGWLYQFYVASNREDFRKAKVVTKDLIPTLSQIFTPDWIVRYMADNSVGRLWIESYPNSPLKQFLTFYVGDADQDEETQKKLEEIKYKNVNPEEIKIIEPCCGSGHILVYVFDLLLNMYLEQGYNKRDIPALILKNNLYGLDVDKRAAQLAKFSLIMKARSIDNRFFGEDRFVNPRVFEIKDSQLLISLNYKDAMKSLHFSEDSIKLTEYLVNTFEYGKVIGSLLKVAPKDYTPLVDDIKRCKEIESPGIFEQDFYDKGLKRLRYLVRVARVLARKYDVMITNPPYLSSTKLEKEAHDYSFAFYPNSKDDMFAMFMETNFLKANGFRAMVNPDSWMFLTSYEKLRYNLNNQVTLINMLHHGMGAFDAVVQTTSFIFRNVFVKNYVSSIFDFKAEVKNKTYNLEASTLFLRTRNDFSALPSCQYAYDVSMGIVNAFKNGTKIELLGEVVTGVSTGDNDKYIRYWPEVDYDTIAFYSKSMMDINLNKTPWIPVTKGGPARKWYGNFDAILLWREHKKFHRDRSTNSHLYLKEGITWSKITTGMFSARFFDNGFVWLDAGSPCVISDKKISNYVLGFLGTNICAFIMKLLNPTISCQVVDVQRVPIIVSNEHLNEVNDIVEKCIEISKSDWDSKERSWSFKCHPLVIDYFNGNRNKTISDCYLKFENDCNERFDALKRYEERLNSIFNQIYKLEDEFSDKVEDKAVTVEKCNVTDTIKSLISYFIGLLMGRYSLKKTGLIYAGGDISSFTHDDYVDEDGIIPIYEFVGMNDGLTKRICDLVKKIYGDTYYKENLNYIGKAIGMRSDEGAEEAINRYLNNEFYLDHIKTYSFRGQKYPIYWMFDSGKQGAFKCLAYYHRLNQDTLAKINTSYFLPRTAMYKAEKERLLSQTERADIAKKKKIETQITKVELMETELEEYGQVLDHLANQRIDLDKEQGIEKNYLRFQQTTLQLSSATKRINLLYPIGIEEE